eukprot:scaffold4504_cov116-Isochrysis_galbana.AAC.14
MKRPGHARSVLRAGSRANGQPVASVAGAVFPSAMPTAAKLSDDDRRFTRRGSNTAGSAKRRGSKLAPKMLAATSVPGGKVRVAARSPVPMVLLSASSRMTLIWLTGPYRRPDSSTYEVKGASSPAAELAAGSAAMGRWTRAAARRLMPPRTAAMATMPCSVSAASRAEPTAKTACLSVSKSAFSYASSKRASRGAPILGKQQREKKPGMPAIRVATNMLPPEPIKTVSAASLSAGCCDKSNPRRT